MEIYITKPAHSEYGHGRIPINNRFSTIDELIENSKVWFNKPSLTKPFLDIFTDKFIFRGWHNYHLCYILVKDFPECQVKEFVKNKIRESVFDDFSETYKNKHYRWVYPINVKITSSEEPGNFDLYVKKPSSVHDIQYAGIDRFKIYLEDPKSPLFNDHTSYLLGRLLERRLNLNTLCIKYGMKI